MIQAHSSARWIWCGGEPSPKNFYLYVRKSLHLSRPLRHLIVRATADSRYQLYVNGILSASGPARCDRRWQCVDEWNVTAECVAGANVFAALVHHYGEWTFSYMHGRGGFLAEIEAGYADGTVECWGTDATWLVKPATAWDRALPRMSIQQGFPEVYDARAGVHGWNRADVDESGWEPAAVLGPPGMEPWPQLEARDIPALTSTPVTPAAVIDSGELGPASTGHYIDLHRVAWSTKNGVAYLATWIWSPAAANLELRAGSQESLRLWLNDRLIVDHLITRDPGPDQEIVPVHLLQGWNAVRAKVTQGEGQWHFYFRIVGQGSEPLVYATEPGDPATHADDPAPWLFIGPFPAASMQDGHEQEYPPEHGVAPETSYRLTEGLTIGWRSAGVSRESRLTSVIMSREERRRNLPPRIVNAAGTAGGPSPATFLPGPEHGAYVLLDFGREVAGYPAVQISGASGGEIIDIGYGEILQDEKGEAISPASHVPGILNPDRAGVHYADRYICRPGDQGFRTFDKRAFRYLQLDVRDVRTPLSVGPVSLELATYPVQYAGSFQCSDEVLNRIWETGRWTVQLNMEDAYTDCPWRERGQWWGDARVEALVNYYAFGDRALIRRGLRQMARSRSDDGFTRGIYPTDWSYAILPTFSLLWIITLHDCLLYTGDEALVRELWPSVTGVLDTISRYRGEHGLLRDVPYWLFVDWADVDTSGESSSVNALYHGALLSAAELATATGMDPAPHIRTADDVRAAMDRWLWDDHAGLYRESWRSGVLSAKAGEQANAWAICFGVAEEKKRGRIFEALQGEGIVRTGTPYFGMYLLDALAADGRHAGALEYVRSRWKPMLDWGATTWWEQWEPRASFCHGWSAGSTCFLSSEILGVKPLRPGWTEVLVEPHPAGLRFASGTVPTPCGPIHVEWSSGDIFTLTVESPRPMTVSMPILEKGILAVAEGPGGGPAAAEWTIAGGMRVRAAVGAPGRYTFTSR